jgi:hypothetical protein
VSVSVRHHEITKRIGQATRSGGTCLFHQMQTATQGRHKALGRASLHNTQAPVCLCDTQSPHNTMPHTHNTHAHTHNTHKPHKQAGLQLAVSRTSRPEHNKQPPNLPLLSPVRKTHKRGACQGMLVTV